MVRAGVVELGSDGAENGKGFVGGVPKRVVAFVLFAHVAQGVERTPLVELVDGNEVGKIEHVNLFSFFQRWIAVGGVEPRGFCRTEQQLFFKEVLTIGFSGFVVRHNHYLHQRPALKAQFVEYIHGGIHLLYPHLERRLIDEAIQQGAFHLSRFNAYNVRISRMGYGIQLNIGVRRLFLGPAKGTKGEEEAQDN